jgi:hypothetical protein
MKDGVDDASIEFSGKRYQADVRNLQGVGLCTAPLTGNAV